MHTSSRPHKHGLWRQTQWKGARGIARCVVCCCKSCQKSALSADVCLLSCVRACAYAKLYSTCTEWAERGMLSLCACSAFDRSTASGERGERHSRRECVQAERRSGGVLRQQRAAVQQRLHKQSLNLNDSITHISIIIHTTSEQSVEAHIDQKRPPDGRRLVQQQHAAQRSAAARALLTQPAFFTQQHQAARRHAMAGTIKNVLIVMGECRFWPGVEDTLRMRPPPSPEPSQPNAAAKLGGWGASRRFVCPVVVQLTLFCTHLPPKQTTPGRQPWRRRRRRSSSTSA